MSDANDSSTSGTERIPPLNLTREEVDYLWEMIQYEIGDEDVWEDGYPETVESLHTKIGEAVGAFEDGDRDV